MENKKIAQAIFDTIGNSILGWFIFWSLFLLSSRFLGYDLTNDFPPNVYIVLFIITGIGWGILYIAEIILRMFVPDDSSMKYYKILAGMAMIISVLMWLSFCLILSARPAGPRIFIMMLVVTAAIFMELILIKNFYLEKKDRIKARIKYYLGLEEDDGDDDDDDFYYY